MDLKYDYLVVGGGIAGTTAAEAVRAKDPHATIAILEDENHFLYSRVFLPAYSRGEIGLEKVMLRAMSDYEKKRLDIYLGEDVSTIDFERREARTYSGKVYSYKKLLLSSGGRAESWQFEKEFSDRILRLQTLENAERIRTLFKEGKIKSVLVVGGGFIALEFLNIFKSLGLEVCLLARRDYFWEGRVDAAGGDFLREIFSRKGVKQFYRDEIFEIRRAGEGLSVITKNGERINCDFIAAGVGLRRNLELGAGVLNVGEGIRVNEFLEAREDLSVWAAGDAAEYFDVWAGDWRVVGNWSHAFQTGHLAGLNMAGEKKTFRSVSTYSLKVFGAVLTLVGETEEKEGIEAVTRWRASDKKYSRFFLKSGKLIGAVLINSFQQKPAIARLIEAGRDFYSERSELANPDFELSKFL